MLGQVHAHPDHPDLEDAGGILASTLALATALGMRPLIAECHLALGTLSGRAGNRRGASEGFTIARTMFGEMGMTYWLDKTEAELKASG